MAPNSDTTRRRVAAALLAAEDAARGAPPAAPSRAARALVGSPRRRRVVGDAASRDGDLALVVERPERARAVQGRAALLALAPVAFDLGRAPAAVGLPGELGW